MSHRNLLYFNVGRFNCVGRRRFRIDTEVHCMVAHPLFAPLSRRGLNPIKPVYDPDWPDGRLNLTASSFNQIVSGDPYRNIS